MPAEDNLRAILFDMDGVLWDSNGAHRRAFETALKEAGSPWPMTPKRYAGLAGMRTELVLKKLSALGLKADLEKIARRKRFWAERYLKRAPMRRGLRQTLRTLARRYRLALVTSGHPVSVGIFLKRSGLRRSFSAILSSREIPYSKPSPRVYQGALKRLGLGPRRAIVVEDAEQGVRSAVGAGIRTIGIRGTCSDKVLRRAGAQAIISELPDIFKYVADS